MAQATTPRLQRYVNGVEIDDDELSIYAELAEVLVDQDGGSNVGVRFDNGCTYVLTAAAAASVGRGLISAADASQPRAVTPAKARWA